MRYSEFVGHDSSSTFGAWPTSSGTMAETGYSVPVYRGWPDKPYEVLGSLRLENPNQTWDEGDFAIAARQAKAHDGNAIIVRHGSEFGVAHIVGTKNEPSIYAFGGTSALVIRWLAPEKITTEERERDALVERYKLEHPGANPEFGKLVFAFLVRERVARKSAEFEERFFQTFKRLTHGDDGSLQGEWLFKAVVSGGSAISGEETRDYLGIAAVTLTGQNVTIISREGGAELSFGGTITDGKLIGQLGLGSYSASCDGVASPDKISISFQSRAADGFVRGNIIFQRQNQHGIQNEKTGASSSSNRT